MTPFLDFIRFGIDAIRDGAAMALQAYRRLYNYAALYVVMVFATIFCCWLLNISGNKFLIHAVILIAIPWSFALLIRPGIAIPFIILDLLHYRGYDDLHIAEMLNVLARRFCILISSITYAAIWPMLVLSYRDLATPGAFWMLLLCATMICLLENISDGSKKRFTRFVAVATPRKLLLQFVMNGVKLTLALT